MESPILGLVLDSSVLIAAERRKLTAAERRKLTATQTIESVRTLVDEVPMVLCALTLAEVGHGIYRANTPEVRGRRRAFLDELKATARSNR